MLKQKLPRQLEDLLKAGDIQEAKKLFSQCEPNAQTCIGSNVFSLSPMPEEFAIWAKEQGADINFRNDSGNTPIFDIIRLDGNIPLLIKLGADIEAAAPGGFTPLHAAATRGRMKAVRALLKAGACVDAQTMDFGGFCHFTPLEAVLIEPDLSSTKKYDICRLLLKHGAGISERCRQFVSAFSETFYRHNAGKKVTKFIQNQEASLRSLCQLFDAEMLPASSFHDGVSPIIVTNVGGFKDNFKELWNFLVPPDGRAQTAQGEVIRIAGRIEHELLDNGGLNWGDDYRKMLYTFRDYLNLTNPYDGPDPYVEEIVDALKDGDVLDNMIWRLCYRARHWVEENPEVRPLLEADYTR